MFRKFRTVPNRIAGMFRNFRSVYKTRKFGTVFGTGTTASEVGDSYA